MTEKEIIQIWNSVPYQADPTGRKFAIKFAREIEKKVFQNQEDELEAALRELTKLSEGSKLEF